LTERRHRGPDRANATDPRVLIAIDVGTSSARATAFDLRGNRLLEVRRPYPTITSRPGWSEQDAALWWRSVVAALGHCARQLAGRPIAAIGLTGQCPSMVLVDERERPLGLALTYRDNRAARQARDMTRRYGRSALHRRTGHVPQAFHIGPKLLWIRENELPRFAAARRVLQPRDYILLNLCGEVATDPTHAPGTALFDVTAGAWDESLLEDLELDADLLPQVVPSATVVGDLRREVADRVGFRGSVPVVLGGADSQSCAFGVGVIAPGIASEMAGSSTCVNTVVAEVLADERITHYGHVLQGRLTTELGLNTTGSAVEWAANLLYPSRRGQTAIGELSGRLERVPPGSRGVTVTPTFADGERDDVRVRASIRGLSLRHDRDDLMRSVLEGVAFGIRDHVAVLSHAGGPLVEMRISGGGTRLDVFNQIKADVLGLPVRVFGGDAAASGAAALAGLAVGVFTGPKEAAEWTFDQSVLLEPVPSEARAYASMSSSNGR
jgi:xylulokinase